MGLAGLFFFREKAPGRHPIRLKGIHTLMASPPVARLKEAAEQIYAR